MNERMINMHVEGLDVLERQLRELFPALKAQRVIQTAARKAMKPVLVMAKALVPVDTGLLRDSIVLATAKPSSGDTVVAVGLTVKPTKGDNKRGSAHWRWHFIEKGKKGYAAHPFLRPALDRFATYVVMTLREELSAAIAREVKKRTRLLKGKR